MKQLLSLFVAFLFISIGIQESFAADRSPDMKGLKTPAPSSASETPSVHSPSEPIPVWLQEIHKAERLALAENDPSQWNQAIHHFTTAVQAYGEPARIDSSLEKLRSEIELLSLLYKRAKVYRKFNTPEQNALALGEFKSILDRTTIVQVALKRIERSLSEALKEESIKVSQKALKANLKRNSAFSTSYKKSAELAEALAYQEQILNHQNQLLQLNLFTVKNSAELTLLMGDVGASLKHYSKLVNHLIPTDEERRSLTLEAVGRLLDAIAQNIPESPSAEAHLKLRETHVERAMKIKEVFADRLNLIYQNAPKASERAGAAILSAELDALIEQRPVALPLLREKIKTIGSKDYEYLNEISNPYALLLHSDFVFSQAEARLTHATRDELNKVRLLKRAESELTKAADLYETFVKKNANYNDLQNPVAAANEKRGEIKKRLALIAEYLSTVKAFDEGEALTKDLRLTPTEHQQGLWKLREAQLSLRKLKENPLTTKLLGQLDPQDKKSNEVTQAIYRTLPSFLFSPEAPSDAVKRTQSLLKRLVEANPADLTPDLHDQIRKYRALEVIIGEDSRGVLSRQERTSILLGLMNDENEHPLVRKRATFRLAIRKLIDDELMKNKSLLNGIITKVPKEYRETVLRNSEREALHQSLCHQTDLELAVTQELERLKGLVDQLEPGFEKGLEKGRDHPIQGGDHRN